MCNSVNVFSLYFPFTFLLEPAVIKQARDNTIKPKIIIINLLFFPRTLPSKGIIMYHNYLYLHDIIMSKQNTCYLLYNWRTFLRIRTVCSLVLVFFLAVFQIKFCGFSFIMRLYNLPVFLGCCRHDRFYPLYIVH